MQRLTDLINEPKPMMLLNIVHISQSKTTRDIQVFNFDSSTQKFENISNLVALELDMPFNNGGVRIKGVGADMCFMLKHFIESYIYNQTGKNIEIFYNGFVKEKDLNQCFKNMINYYNNH